MKDIMSNNIHVSTERQLITYVDFWDASRFFLENGQQNERGSYYQFLGSLVFSAFTFEAFLNHIGAHLFSSWSELERKLSHRAKLALISEKLNFEIDYGRLPWQIIPKLFGFRDKVAHGKNEMLRLEKVVSKDDPYEELLHQFLFSDWQKFATDQNASSARTHLEEIMLEIHSLAKIENEQLFRNGNHVGSALLIQV
jgi:hypothetical protein